MPGPRTCFAIVLLSAVAACAAAPHGKSLAMPSMAMSAQTAPATGSAPTATQIPEQLVVEGSLHVEVEEVGDLVDALRKQVETGGGRIVAEDVSGGETSWSARIKLRLPPAQVEPIVAWLAGRGEVLAKQITATDVSRTLFDQELALANLMATSDRLQKLLDAGGLAMNDILAIEKELTRIRGEVESIKGSKRFLEDRVSLATLDLVLSRRDGAVTIATAKFYPGARFATMVLLDPDGRRRTRIGAGLVLHTVMRSASLEVDLFQPEQAADAADDPTPGVIATFGGAAYSDFLGRGRRKLLNPYMGLRVGYAYLDSSRFAVQAEAGVELFKHSHLVIDANVRATGLIGKDSDGAVVGGAGAVVAF